MMGNDGFSQGIRDASLDSKILNMSMKHYTKGGDFHTLEQTDQHVAAKYLEFCKSRYQEIFSCSFLSTVIASRTGNAGVLAMLTLHSKST